MQAKPSFWRRGRSALRLATLACGLCQIFSQTANAQTATSSFNVTATVEDACTISASNLSFGVYSSISGAALDGTSIIQVRCTLSSAYDVALNAGSTSGGAISARLMTDGSNTLGYNLYTSNARTTVWGDNTGGSSSVTGTGTGLTANLTVYGRIGASQNLAAGSFSDTVIATISF